MSAIPDDARIIQRNIVFVSGIPSTLCNEKILTCSKWFGQFGKIQHIDIGNNMAYIEYDGKMAAANAINTMHLYEIPETNMMLKVNYAVNRFCKYWLTKMDCIDPGCSFIHYNVNSNDIVFQTEIDEYFNDKYSKIDQLQKENGKLKRNNLELIKLFEIHETQSIINKMENDLKLKELQKENDKIKEKHYLLIKEYNTLKQKYNINIDYKSENIALTKILQSMLYQ